MLIENKEEKILVLPSTQKIAGLRARVKKQKVVMLGGKKIKAPELDRLIPGINEIPDILWIEYKKQSKIKEKIENKLIVEMIIETEESKKIETEIKKDESELLKDKTEVEDKKRKLKSGRIPKTQVEEVKEEVESFVEEEKIRQEDIALKKEEYLKKVSNFNNLNIKEKETIIKNCFDIFLLNKWREEDTKGEVKKFIDEQIESIDKAVIQPGLKKPPQITDKK